MKINTIYFKPSFWARVGVMLGKPIVINFKEPVKYYYSGKNSLEIDINCTTSESEKKQ